MSCSSLNSQGTYVNFGTTTSGLDVLEKILALNVNENNGLGGAPSKLVLVKIDQHHRVLRPLTPARLDRLDRPLAAHPFTRGAHP